MLSYIVQRFLLGILTLFVLTAISWVIIELPPGDFVDMYVEELIGGNIGEGGGFLVDVIEEGLRQQYGLDSPSYVRYSKWMWRMMQGDLGVCLEFG